MVSARCTYSACWLGNVSMQTGNWNKDDVACSLQLYFSVLHLLDMIHNVHHNADESVAVGGNKISNVGVLQSSQFHKSSSPSYKKDKFPLLSAPILQGLPLLLQLTMGRQPKCVEGNKQPHPKIRSWSHLQQFPYVLCQQSSFEIDKSHFSITNY